MAFVEFCLGKANGDKLETPFFTEDHDTVSPPEKYKGPLDVLIKNMKIKRDIFDRVSVPYVENAFNGDYKSILDDKLDDGEVPDAMIEYLADGIYGDKINNLDYNQRSIIKVLSVYICIQN